MTTQAKLHRFVPPPQSLEAEQAVLGAMFLEMVAVDKASGLLQPADFYREAHKLVFAAMVAVAGRGDPVDLITLGAELEDRGQLQRAGGRPYLAGLLDAVPTAAHVDHYAQIVRRKAILRRLIGACTDVVDECYGDVEDVDDVVSRAESAVRATAGGSGGVDIVRMCEAMEGAKTDLHAPVLPGKAAGMVPSGLKRLDKIIGGWQPGHLVYVAGRPSMGKTSLMMTCALNAARHTSPGYPEGVPVLMFSFEMSGAEVVERWLQMATPINSDDLRGGDLTPLQVVAVEDGIQRLRPLPICWYAGPAITPREIGMRCRRIRAEMGLGLVIVDYLQLMTDRGRRDGRTQEVDDLSRGLKALAAEMGLPVLVGSQLSRRVEDRDPPLPNLAHLRESGSIEADANIVILLFNPAQHKRQKAQAEDEHGGDAAGGAQTCAPDLVRVHVAKQRSGRTGLVTLGFQPAFSRFVDLAPEEGP